MREEKGHLGGQFSPQSPLAYRNAHKRIFWGKARYTVPDCKIQNTGD
jgi:hypothetical protein